MLDKTVKTSSPNQNNTKKYMLSELYEIYLSEDLELEYSQIYDYLTSYILNGATYDRYQNLLTKTLKLYKDEMFQKFMDNYFNYLISKVETSVSDKQIFINVFTMLVKLFSKLNTGAKLKLNQFLWSMKSVHNIVKYYPKKETSLLYSEDSILNSIEESKDVHDTYESLIKNQDIALHLLVYMTDIVNKNIPYTHDDPRLAGAGILCSFDYCVKCLTLGLHMVYQHVNDKNIIENERYLDFFWKNAYVYYLTIGKMKNSVMQNIEQCDTEIRRMEEFYANGQYREVSYKVKKEKIEMKNRGLQMLHNLHSMTQHLDIQKIENIILANFDHLISSKRYDIMSAIRNYFTLKRSAELKNTIFHEIVLKVVSLEDMPIHIKFDYVRLIMSHNIKDKLFELSGSTDTMIKYLIEDVPKLKELENIHYIDLMVDLADSPVMENPEIVELYMDSIPAFTVQYIDLLKTFNQVDSYTKPTVMHDITNMINASSLMVRNFPILEYNTLSYINDMVLFVDTICDTKQHIRDSNDPKYIKALSVFDVLKSTYVENIKPLIAAMLSVLSTKYNVIIEHSAKQVLVNDLGLELDSRIKVIGDVPDDLTDSVKFDLAINPYYLPTGDNNLHLIDRKTLVNICRKGENPFTREKITKQEILEYNETDEIKNKRQETLGKIKELYDTL